MSGLYLLGLVQGFGLGAAAAFWGGLLVNAVMDRRSDYCPNCDDYKRRHGDGGCRMDGCYCTRTYVSRGDS